MSDRDCPDKLEPEPKPNVFDTVLVYCQACQARIDIPIVHKEATNNQFQLVSIPKEFAYKVENYRAYCNQCGNTNIIERQNHVNHYEVFTVKLDCSNMNHGTNDWYENDLSSRGDGHPHKF